MKIDILFVLPWYPLPRIIRRIEIANKIGKVGIIFWKKNTTMSYPNKLPEDIEICPIEIEASDGIDTARIMASIAFGKEALKKIIEMQPKCIHVTKTDLLVWITKFYKKCANDKKPYVIYEVSDLHDLAYNDKKDLFHYVIKKILFFAERKMMECVNYIILTSPYFWTAYYAQMQIEKPWLYIPNAASKKVFAEFVPKLKGPFTLGYIGNLTHYEQLSLLFDIAAEKNIDIFIAGAGVAAESVKKTIGVNSHITFWGKYEYEKDIATLYGKIDCISALYYSESKNTKVALPNRLYDAAMCGVPVLASRGTVLGDLVDQYHIGVAVNRREKKDILRGIDKIMETDKNIWKINAENFLKECSDIEANEYLKSIYRNAIYENN